MAFPAVRSFVRSLSMRLQDTEADEGTSTVEKEVEQNSELQEPKEPVAPEHLVLMVNGLYGDNTNWSMVMGKGQEALETSKARQCTRICSGFK